MVEPSGSPDLLAEHPQYKKVKDLGLGSFGSVALYQRHEGRAEPSLCAVKFMPRSGPGVDVNLIQREIQSHRVLRHPHVIRFKQLGLTASHIFMCMEYADQGDLLGFLRRKGPLPEADARWLFQQIIFGLDYCHLKGVVNRDLKPENLLLKLTPEAIKRHRRHQQQEREQQQRLWEQMQQLQLQQQQAGNGISQRIPATPPSLPPIGLIGHRTSNSFSLHIKIADFGLSKRAAHSLPKTRVGTINYMAPEVLLAGPALRYDGAKADIWSAGVVLYAMVFSRVPFEPIPDQPSPQQSPNDPQKAPPPQTDRARDRAATIHRILNGEWAVPPGMNVSPQCLHLLTQMLIPDPARRISMQAIMEHPWFRAGLPTAALTMNTALVRQQASQGTTSAGEQSEAEVDALLEELRLQAEADGSAAVAAALAVVSQSRSSDDNVEERRAFDIGSLEEQPWPPADAATRRIAPRVGGAGKESPAMTPLVALPPAGAMEREQYVARSTEDLGGRRSGGETGPQSRPDSEPGGVGGCRGGGNGGGGRAFVGQQGAGGSGPNGFLALLAGLGPEEAVAVGGKYAEGGGGGGGTGLTPGSSESRRAEALDAIDFIVPRKC